MEMRWRGGRDGRLEFGSIWVLRVEGELAGNPARERAAAATVAAGKRTQVARLPQWWRAPMRGECLAVGSLVNRLRFYLDASPLCLKVQAEGQ